VPKLSAGVLVALLCAVALLAAALVWTNARASGGGSHPDPVAGTRLDRPLPPLTLVDEQGRTVSVDAWRGKIVVIAPFLSLCNELCPITTGAFDEMQRVLRRDGLSGKVVLAEVTVDPWRDSPARLRAYARMTDTRFPLYTGSLGQIRAFWRFFGVFFKRVPEGRPAQIDWWTHRRLTFDVAHTDGLMFVDAAGRWRIAILGMPDVHGRLAASLAALLSSAGRQNLEHPMAPWTLPQALGDIGALLGRPVATSGA
jgi:protein SCO1/2